MKGLEFIILSLLLMTTSSFSISIERRNGMIFETIDTPFTFGSPEALESLKEIADLKVNWISIVSTWFQENINSTNMKPTNNTPTEQDLKTIVAAAKFYNLSVIFKPHVDTIDTTGGQWRGEIGTHFDEDKWRRWFKHYTLYIAQMAMLAEEMNVSTLIIGTELSMTETHEIHWRTVAATARTFFKGEITYGGNWAYYPGGPFKINWWDAVDFIGIDAYFPIASIPNPDLSDLRDGWDQYIGNLTWLSNKWSKPIMFTEIGYQPMNDTAMHPWASNGALDLEAQALCYQAYYEFVFEQDFMLGVTWWAFTTDPNAGGLNDTSFTPAHKPASLVVAEYSNETMWT